MLLSLCVQLLCLLAIALCAGCASLRNERPRHWTNAVGEAALAPETIAPLALAGGVLLTGSDKRISEWAGDRAPVFGSRQNADRRSNDLAAVASFSGVATALLVPGKGGADSVRTKGTCLTLGFVARGLTGASTSALKSSSGRARPDSSDRMSFPSAHSSDAAVNATLAARNIERLPLTGPWRTGLRGGVTVLAAGTAWARIEAQKHYPTDVLAGAALGGFFGNLFSNVWLPVGCSVSVQPLEEASTLVVRLAF